MPAVDPAVFVPRHHAPKQPDDPFAGCFRERGSEEPRGYRVRSDEVWAAAREDYEIGHSAETVCRRMNLGLSAFRQRARREGWRREDQAADEPMPRGDEMEPEAAPPTPELADLAWRSMAEAIRLGDVYKARAWMRLHAELRKVVQTEDRTLTGAAMTAGLKAAADSAETDDMLAAIKGIETAARAHASRLNALCSGAAADEDAGDGCRTDVGDEMGFDRLNEGPGGDPPGELHRLHPESGVQSPPPTRALTPTAGSSLACHPGLGEAESRDPGTEGANRRVPDSRSAPSQTTAKV